MKKFLAILLALIMVLGMVACGAETETKTETTETKTETTTTEKTEEKKEETKEETKEEVVEETTEEEWPMIEASAIVFTGTGFTPRAESWGVDYYRENYGLDLEIMQVDSSTDESWNIFWAGGGYADIILPYGAPQARQIVAEDICRTIEYDWFKEYMPRLHTLLTKYYGSDEEIQKALDINGDVYCIPYFLPANGFNTAFRADWLENLGLETPDTLEELEEVVRAFAEDDPDGNGVDDTFAFSGGETRGVFSLAAMFNTSSEISWILNYDDGTFSTNLTTDEQRQYLATLAKWYKNGWIDPEFLTDDRAAARQKLANGQIGIYSDDPWWWEAARGESGPLQMLCATQNLDFATACTFTTLWESEITGEPVYNTWNAWINGQASVYFGYDATDEMVIRMMQMLDETVRMYTFDEEDLQAIREYAIRSYGEHEGEYWEIDETGRVRLLDVEKPQGISNEEGWYLFPVAGDYDLNAYEGQPDAFNKKNYEEAMSLNKIYLDSNVTLPTLSTISTELGDKQVNVNDYASTIRADFITGAKDINDDAAWAEYVATLEEYGINDIKAAYEEYFAAMG